MALQFTQTESDRTIGYYEEGNYKAVIMFNFKIISLITCESDVGREAYRAYRVLISPLHVEPGAPRVQEVLLACDDITSWKRVLSSIIKQTFKAKVQHHLPFEECLWTELVNKHLVEQVEEIYYQRPADNEGINLKYVKMMAEQEDGHMRKENLEMVYKEVVFDCNGKVKEKPTHAVTEHLTKHLKMKKFVPSGLEGYLDIFQPPFLSRCQTTREQQLVMLMAMTVEHFYSLVMMVCNECPAIQLVSKEPETHKTTICLVGMKLIGDERNFMAEGSSQEACEKLRSLSSLPIVKDDSESQRLDHKSMVRGFNQATKSTLSRGSSEPMGGEIVNKNIKPQETWDLKLTEGRGLFFVTSRSSMFQDEEVGETCKSKANFVAALRSTAKPRDFLASLTKYFFSNDPETPCVFQEALMEACIKLEQKKPEYGKRKLMNNALIPAMFSLIKKEVEESGREDLQERYVTAFRDEEFFFDLVVQELDKVEELLQEMQVMTEEEKRRVTRKTSITEDDESVDDKVDRVLNAVKEENDLEKSKIIKIFKEKSGVVTLGIRKPTLRNLLSQQGKEMINFPNSLFKSKAKIFTKEDSVSATGKGSTGAFQCSVLNISALLPLTRTRVLAEVLPPPGVTVTYQEDLEEEEVRRMDRGEEGVMASQDFPQSQQVLKTCQLCQHASGTTAELILHIKETHPRCIICKEQFNSVEELMGHKMKHARVKCSKCNKMILKEEMTSHKEEHNVAEHFKKAVNNAKIRKNPEVKSKTQNPWLAFCKLERPKIKQDHPLYNSGQIKTELSRRWKDMSHEEKELYRGDPEEAEEIIEEEPAIIVEAVTENIINESFGNISLNNIEAEAVIDAVLDEGLENISLNNILEIDDDEVNINAAGAAGGSGGAAGGAGGAAGGVGAMERDFSCPHCDHEARSNTDLREHLLRHRHRQRTLSVSGELGEPLPVPEVVLWQSTKLQWPAKVLNRDKDMVEIMQLGKNKKRRRVGADTISPFVFSVVSAKNSDQRLAFREARDMVDKR